jgi:BirA family biotin operon repressor/biotin-[acetyl-CoA-carboxylase] ligase
MIHRFKSVTSTQDILKTELAPGAQHLDAVIADEQTSGRGRLGREWVSEAGNLFASVYLNEFSLPLTWVPHWVGVSIARALYRKGVDPLRLRLKWPNDLYWDRTAKVGGILCEKVDSGVVVGFGINLNSHPEISGRPTAALDSTTGVEVEPFPLLESILKELKTEPSVEVLRKDYEQFSLYRPGDSLSWADPMTGAEGSGKVLSLGDHGELLVEVRETGLPAIRALFSEEVRGLSLNLNQ